MLCLQGGKLLSRREIEIAAELRSVLVTRATRTKQQRQQPILSLKQVASQRLAMSQSMHTIGIISIGEIGLGIWLVLIAHSHSVLRSAAGRRYNQHVLIVFFTR